MGDSTKTTDTTTSSKSNTLYNTLANGAQTANSTSGTNTGAQSNTAQNVNTTNSPWTPQQQELLQAFQAANGAFNTASGVAAPSNFTAGMTPQQLAIFSAMSGAGTNSTGIGSTIGNAGAAGATTGLGGAGSALATLLGYDPTKTNNAGSVLNTAQQYVNGVNIPGQVKNAMQSATEEARDVTNPQILNSAASTGNVNSSRTGIAQGIVDRGLAEQAGNLSATLGNNAWATGTGLGESIDQSNNTNALDAIKSALAGGTSLGTAGAVSGASGINDLTNSYGLANTGAGAPQQNQQLSLNNALQQYLMGISSPFAPVNSLMGVIGSNNWGTNVTGTTTGNTSATGNTNTTNAGTGTTTNSGSGSSNTKASGTSNSTETTSPSAFDIIGGLLGAGGKAASGFADLAPFLL